MTSSNIPAPATPPDPNQPGRLATLLGKVIDRLPPEVPPGWYFAAFVALLLATIWLAYIAAPWLAGVGGLVGLTALINALRGRV
ncbi:hypothetical protein ABZ342_44595 [Amycolatopsis sp. NPDC005961]|uniref:hypothetical protein n=1 Tax=Amycolatopsis sp. NPDC005961 TaxID=3156720 RepID=UPI00340D8605